MIPAIKKLLAATALAFAAGTVLAQAYPSHTVKLLSLIHISEPTRPY